MVVNKQKIRERCEYLLEGLVGHDKAEEWWDSPNKHWEGKTPREVFDGSEAMEVHDYLMNHAYGGQYS